MGSSPSGAPPGQSSTEVMSASSPVWSGQILQRNCVFHFRS